MGMKKMRRKSFNHDIRGMLELTPSEGGDHEIERIVELHNKLWPDEPKTIEALQAEEAARDTTLFFRRFFIKNVHLSSVVIHTIGEVWCEQQPGIEDTYIISIHVDPAASHLEHGEKGICAYAIQTVIEHIKENNPKLIKLITTWRSDKKKRIEFLLKTGFTQLDYLDQEIPKRVWVTYQKVT